MTNRPGGPIRWRLHLPVPPERVFDAIDSDAGRAAFWAESAVASDGVITFRFSSGETCAAPILERRRPDTWRIDYLGGPVTFTLADDGAGGTDLTLTHEGLSGSDWIATHAGWLNVLLPLKAWLVHGVDLRSHDPARSWDAGYVDP